MKKLGFEQQGTATYLTYEFEPDDVVDSMSLGMLMNNQIPGFAQALFTQVDEKRRIKFNVTARVSADQYLHGTVNRKRLTGVLQGIVTAMLAAEEYMIDPNTIQLELSSIFSDVVTADTVVICVPKINKDVQPQDPLLFFKDIVFGVQYDPQEDQNYVGRILSYLNGTKNFSASDFKGVLDYLTMETAAPAPQPGPPVQLTQPPQFVPAAQQPAVHLPPEPPITPSDLSPQPEQAPSADGKVSASIKPEDRISLFYLLQHYNKDNAAAYKSQKEEKKAEKQREKEAKKTAKKEKKSKKAVEKAAPGTSADPGFSIPGQELEQRTENAAQAIPSVSSVQSAQSVQPMPPIQQAIPPIPPAQPIQPAPQAPVYQPQYQQYPQYPMYQPAPSERSDETSYFPENEEDGTVIMGQEKQTQRLLPHLIRKRNNERIPLNKALFRLGRDADYNDYAIVGNRYIGHSHCHIICRDGEYFVADDNSKNHTKVNQEQVMPGQEKKIAHGDIISLADEDFEFKLF